MDTREVAAKRGRQTLVDGLIAAVLVAGLTPLVGAIQTADGWTTLFESWREWSWSIFQAATVALITALIAYFRRRYVDPWSPTPEVAASRRASTRA